MFSKVRQSFDVNEMVKAILECPGDINEGWRKPLGYWGTVVRKYGLENSYFRRKGMYTAWRQNKRNIQEKYFDHEARRAAKAVRREVASNTFIL